MAKALNVSMSVTADVSQAKAQLASLESTLASLNANSANLKVGLDANQLKEASTAAQQLGIYLKQATNQDTGQLNFAKLNTSIKNSGMTLNSYGAQLLKLGPQGQQAFSQLAAAVAKSNIPMNRFSGMLGNFGTVLGNTIRWQAASTAIHSIMGSIQGAYSYAQNLNRSLNDIQIVTQASDQHMADFAKSANAAAKQLSTTTTAYTNASLIYYQQGLSDKEVAERTNATIKLANITGQSAEAVSSQLTAIWNNFDDGTKSLEYYGDVITALGAATASSSEEISKGLSKFAPIAETVGLSYENASAALATIIATTRQSADSVGTGLRTVFSRLSSVGLGETLDDGVTLTKYSAALDKIGVSVLDAAGNLRSMDAILDDLGTKWGDLTNAQQTAVAQTIGGVRQYTTIMALMNNYDAYQANVDIAKNSEGTIQAQADIYAKSWEASQKRVRASAEAIYDSLINEDFFIGLNNGFSGFLNIINNVINGLGGLKGVLSGVGALMLGVFNNQAATGAVKLVNGLKTLFTPTSKLNETRDNFLLNAAQQMSGVYGTNPTGESAKALSYAQTSLDMQATYARTSMLMSPEQRMFAEQTMNNYEANRQQQLQLSQQGFDYATQRGNIAGTAVAQSIQAAQAEAKNLKAARADTNSFISKMYMDEKGNLTDKYTDAFKNYSKNIAETTDSFAKQKDVIENWSDTSEGALGRFKTALTNAGMTNVDEFTDNLVSDEDLTKNTMEGLSEKLSKETTASLEQTKAQMMDDLKISQEIADKYVKAYQDTANNSVARANLENQMAQEQKQFEENTKINKQVQTASTIMKTAQGLMAMGAASAGIEKVGAAFKNIVTNTGNVGDNVTSLLSSIGQLGISGVMAVNAFSAALTNMGVAATASMGWAAAIVVAVLAISTAIKAIDNAHENQTEKLERLNEEMSQLQTYTEASKTSLEDLLSTKTTHNNLLTELQSLTKGTSEFYEVLSQANETANELISNYGLEFGTGKDWYYDTNHAIQFTSAGNEKLETSAKNQQINNEIAQAGFDIYQDILDRQVKSTDWKELETYLQTQTQLTQGNINSVKSIGANSRWNYLQSAFGLNEQDYLNYLSGSGTSFSHLLGAYINKNELFDASTDSQLALDSSLTYLDNFLTNQGDYYTKFDTELERLKDLSDFQLGQEFEEVMGYKATGDLAKDTASMRNMIAANKVIASFDENIKNTLSTANSIVKNNKNIANYDKLTPTETRQLLSDMKQAGSTANGTIEGAIYNEILGSYNRLITSASETLGKVYGENGEALSREQTEAALDNLFGNNATLTREGLNSALQTFNNVSDTAGGDVAQTFWKAIFGPEGQRFNTELNSILGQINFSKTMDSIFDLSAWSQHMERSGNLELAKTLTDLKNTYLEAIGGDRELLSSVFNTEDMQSNLAALQKQFKDTGRLGAQDIQDVADSCEELNDYLKYGEHNASALAAALQVMSLGGVSSIGDVSETFLDMMDLLGAVESQKASSFDYIDNYKTDRSATDFSSFFGKVGKNMLSEINDGAVGSNSLYQNAAELWGESYSKGLLDFFIKGQTEGLEDVDPSQMWDAYDKAYGKFDEVAKAIQSEGNMSPYWDFLLGGEADSLYGQTRLGGTVSEALAQIGFSNTGKNGDIEVDVGNRTTEQLTQDMANALNLTTEQAGVRLQEFLGYSAGTKHALNVNDAEAAIGVNGEKTLSDVQDMNWAEKAVLAKEYQEVLGEISSETAEYLKTVQEQVETQQSATAQQRAAQEDMVASYGELIKTNENYTEQVKEGANAGKLDLKATMAAGEQVGYTQEEMADFWGDITKSGMKAADVAYEVTDAYGNTINAVEEAADGSVDVQKTLSKATQWLNDADIRHQAETFADAFVTAFGKAATAAEEAKTSMSEAGEGAQTEGAGLNFDITGVINYEIGDLPPAPEGPTGHGVIEYTAVLVGGIPVASGYNNSTLPAFAGGKHSNGQFEGLATVGELGPELWIHNGQPALAGVHGRTNVFLQKDDQIFTASQTREIIRDNPSLNNTPGFYGGKTPNNTSGYGKPGSSSKKKSGGGSSSDDSDFDPERYHYILRLITSLEKEYDKLNDIKDKTYGTNRLEAINREIEATEQLIKANERYYEEAKRYYEQDLADVRALGVDVEVDSFGNIVNYDDLQHIFEAAENGDATAEDQKTALEHLEESSDAMQEAAADLQDLQLQWADLVLEKIVTKAELIVDFDDKEIKYIEHQLKNIEDNIYETAEILTLTTDKMEKVSDKIETSRSGIDEIFDNLTNSKGQSITKDDGSKYTVEDFLAMTPEERDRLHIHDDFGKQVEEWMMDVLDYIETLEDLKTKGIDQVGEAFNELNDDINTAMDKFEHYNAVLSNVKNIAGLQGVTVSATMREVMQAANAAMSLNKINNLKSAKADLDALQASYEKTLKEFEEEILPSGDDTLIQAYQDKLDDMSDVLRTKTEDFTSIWNDSLEQVKEEFEGMLDKIVAAYEESIATIYGTLNGLQDAYDRKKEIQEFYVDDYEKFYQISKLQRNITTDLEKAAKAGNRQNQRMKQLYDDLNNARADGVQLTEYDLDVFAKRYEYEKALMELEDARNSKNEVRLHRDASGNWGYVYTSGLDEDELAKAQQRVEDTFYELQKVSVERINDLSDNLVDGLVNGIQAIRDAYANGEDNPEEMMKDIAELTKRQYQQFEIALNNAGLTLDKAKELYSADFFNILDNLNESALTNVMDTGNDISVFMENILSKLTDAQQQMATAQTAYNAQVEVVDAAAGYPAEQLADLFGQYIQDVADASDKNKEELSQMITDAVSTYDEVLNAAQAFEKEFMETYEPIITRNEEFIEDLMEALDLLNRLEFADEDENPIGIVNDIDSSGSDSSGSGSSGSGSSGSCNGGCLGWCKDWCDSACKGQTQKTVTPPANTTCDNCASSCFSGCKGTCAGTCQDGCMTGCKGTCAGTCFSGCKGTCATTCKDGCMTGCTNSCGGSCGTSCNKACAQQCTGHCSNLARSLGFYSGGYTGNWPVSAATGMYTGSWEGLNTESNGRLAFLHQKEQVFNQTDTQKLLDAAKIVRMIDLSAATYAVGLGALGSPAIGTSGQVLDQNVNITASFPNAVDHNEIEQAFNNLINKASQYANRKDMSSQTFQDAYTSTT